MALLGWLLRRRNSDSALTKSSSALATHAFTVLFIKNFSLGKRFSGERIELRIGASNLAGPSYEQINWESRVRRGENLDGFGQLPSAIIHHNHQIHIRILVRRAIRVRAEQNDLLRREFLSDLAGELANSGRGDHRFT